MAKMKNFIVKAPVIMFAVIAIACNGAETNQNTDTAAVPSALDTIPVLHPGRLDSSGTIKTPETGDENVIMPDCAIKNK